MPTRPARAKVKSKAKATAVSASDVIVDFLVEDGLLFVTLQNIGARPAHDVKVAFDRPFHGAAGRDDVRALRMFKRTPFLAPGRTLRAFIDDAGRYFQRAEPTSITARVSYVDERGRRRSGAMEHDLAIHRELGDAIRVGPGASRG